MQCTVQSAGPFHPAPLDRLHRGCTGTAPNRLARGRSRAEKHSAVRLLSYLPAFPAAAGGCSVYFVAAADALRNKSRSWSGFPSAMPCGNSATDCHP